jgi:aspartyl-tRNA(Asn)/glutamyl-tRNA(Gln) amidotransferase subunit C
MDLSELRTTADLAQLELGEAELVRLGTAVEQMVTHFEKMREIDVDALPPTTHALLSENRTRTDQVLADEPDSRRSTPDLLLESAPELEDRFIVIPNVL